MTKKKCFWKGCNTKVDVDTTLENKGHLFIIEGYCNFHDKVYAKQQEIFGSMRDEYTKKQLKDKFGRTIKFTHHSEVGNYIFLHHRDLYHEIQRGIIAEILNEKVIEACSEDKSHVKVLSS